LLNEIVSEKLRAAVLRLKVAPRDFYDLDFIIRHGFDKVMVKFDIRQSFDRIEQIKGGYANKGRKTYGKTNISV